MGASLKPKDDHARAEMARYCLDVTRSSTLDFDGLAQLAAEVCRTSMSVISLVLEDVQVFKARVGIDACETSRDVAFCSHAILEDSFLIVPDALSDERFHDNPLVTGEPGIRFYAGVVLKLSSGEKIGTLCVLDQMPMQLSPAQIQALRTLAKQVVSLFELRLQTLVLEAAKEKIKSSELKYRSVAQSVTNAIVACDHVGTIISWNRGAEKIFGYSELEALGENVQMVMPDRFKPLHNASMEKSTTAGPLHKSNVIGKTLELFGVRRGGAEFPLELSISTWTTEDGVYYSAILRDITDRKLMINELSTSKNLLELKVNERTADLKHLMESIPQIVWETDLDGSFTYIGQQWIDYTGRALGSGKVREFMHADDLGMTKEKWRVSLTTGLPFQVEFRLKGRDGQYKWFLCRGVLQVSSDGKLKKWFGTCTDINDSKTVNELEIREQSALEASKLKSTFLANMSHEIRTPINGVIGMTGLLLDTKLDDEQRDFADTIRRSGETLLTIINDILDFSKIEAGKLDFEVLDFNLQEVIDDSQKTMSFAAQKKGLKLEVLLEPNLPKRLKGDPGRLKQIFLNLLSNAIKFTAKGTVTLRGALIRDESGVSHLRFEVEDTGMGISKEIALKLFQPFSQADASTQRKFGGTGLGLSICKKLLENWKGEIGVESKPGVGSTFWFEFQMPRGQEIQPQLEAQVSKPAGSLKKARILVVEDNPVNQMIAVKMLQKMGHYSDVAGNGFEAVAAIRSAPYDIVLMDCQMPECDGYEATRLVRAFDTELKNIVILAMTANAMTGDAEKCLEAGMNGYITKPVSKDKLQGILEEWLAKLSRVV